MKRLLALWMTLVLLAACAAACAESAPGEVRWTTKIAAHCAAVEEGRAFMRDRTLFHSQINERALPFYLQRKGGTVEEYIGYSERQVLAFTPRRNSGCRTPWTGCSGRWRLTA